MNFSVVVFVAFIAFTNSETDEGFVTKLVEKIQKITEECVAEAHVDEEDVKAVLEHKIPESHEGKCLLFCFHKHLHIQNDDGSLNVDGALASFEPIKSQNAEIYEKIVNIFNTCSESAPQSEDPCVYASNLAECSRKQGESMGLDKLLVVE